MIRALAILAMLPAIALAASPPVLAQWLHNGNPVCVRLGNQYLSGLVVDEKGYSMATWVDRSDESGIRLYGQLLDPNGEIHWAPGGVPICTAPGDRDYASMVGDADQGYIVAWEQGSGSDIYAQRIDCQGSPNWGPGGIPVCIARYEQESPRIVPARSGGAIIVWSDRRAHFGYYDIYAQRIGKDGSDVWMHNGVCVYFGMNIFPTGVSAVSDGADGVVIAWQRRNWSADGYDIWAQRIDANGVARWGTNGMIICDSPGEQWYPTLALIDSGGIVVAWYDKRNGSSAIYAQMVSSEGALLWGRFGICICDEPNLQSSQLVVESPGGHAILAWNDKRNGTYDIYAQKVNCDGKKLWAAEGVPICVHPAAQGITGLIARPDGGAVVAWSDNRFGGSSVFAQSIDSDGAQLWETDGRAICSTGETAPNSCTIIRMRAGPEDDVFFAWTDSRAGDKDSTLTGLDIYATRTGGALVFATPVNAMTSAMKLGQNYPNPFNPITRIRYEIERAAPVSLRIYDVAGRLVRSLAKGYRAPGAYEECWDGRDSRGAQVASGIYFYRLEAGAFAETRKMALLK